MPFCLGCMDGKYANWFYFRIFATRYIIVNMEIAIILLLILLNGLFALSEVALISARKSNLKVRATQGSNSAKLALRLAEDPDRFLSTVQIGITLIGIMTGIYSGATLSDDLAGVMAEWGIPVATAKVVAQAVIVIIVTYISIVFGELVPKRIGMNAAEKVACIMARPMYWLSVMATPFVWLLSKSMMLVTKIFGLDSDERKVTEAEIKSIIQEGAEYGEVQEVEQRIVGRVFSLGDRTVESIMTHRNDIVWIDINSSPDEIRRLIGNDPHSVYPVADRNLDKLSGVIFLKDIFNNLDGAKFDIKKILQPVKYFHNQTEVYNVLEQLREEHLSYGIVCDEFGVTQGIVTLRNILEALVGDMLEEREVPNIVEREDGGVLIDGQCPFYDFLVYFAIDDVYPHTEYNTISGLVLDVLGHIPETGEKLSWGNFVFEIVDMDGARIDKVLATRESE